MLRSVAVRAVLQFLPAAQVSGRAMQQVAVAGRQQLTHQHHKRIDPHHDQMLTGPAHVIVLRALLELMGKGTVYLLVYSKKPGQM